eukprot:4695523-Pyramimonas_sp.AAC.1
MASTCSQSRGHQSLSQPMSSNQTARRRSPEPARSAGWSWREVDRDGRRDAVGCQNGKDQSRGSMRMPRAAPARRPRTPEGSRRRAWPRARPRGAQCANGRYDSPAGSSGTCAGDDEASQVSVPSAGLGPDAQTKRTMLFGRVRSAF